jgi:hypothetical protein
MKKQVLASCIVEQRRNNYFVQCVFVFLFIAVYMEAMHASGEMERCDGSGRLFSRHKPIRYVNMSDSNYYIPYFFFSSSTGGKN